MREVRPLLMLLMLLVIVAHPACVVFGAKPLADYHNLGQLQLTLPYFQWRHLFCAQIQINAHLASETLPFWLLFVRLLPIHTISPV